MPAIKVCVLRTAGTNCDQETAFAFRKVKAEASLLHVNKLIKGDATLADYQILAIPGGFTYGDDIAAGKILANELKTKLAQELREFVAKGKLIIGICNGFQVLVKSGLLPGNSAFVQECSLIINDSAKFEDRWVYLKSGGKSVWTRNLPEVIHLPVAHGEGKFIASDKKTLKRLKDNGQVVFRYCSREGKFTGYPDNPNGSEEGIAGICDETGRILGLMPHPERHIDRYQDPAWTAKKTVKAGDGLQIFRNAVEYAKKHL
ncbi:MAG TPA: phosphoribosylformylglycinamidine synthase I [Candidatus Margulisiibacteriota bacterium]|nr:phosphoribosylformylglycinamidine synthase I [Candidatus Margulisiibacteriota bacterium]